MNILLKGFYGHGNLGDDLLLITSFNILKEIFPSSHIYIKSNENYINKLIKGDVKLVSDFKGDKYDLTVYGGGGVFYCMTKMTMTSFFKDILIKVYLKLKKGTPKSENWILSVGIGPYFSKNLKYYKDMKFLSRATFLSVRDDESFNQVSKANKDVILGTDLVFSKKHWLDFSLVEQKELNEDYVLFIVRDWKLFDNKLTEELSLVKQLEKKGKEVKFMLFNPKNDTRVAETLKNHGYTFYNYNPEKIIESLQLIKNSELIISQRAHGAIIGNILNVPVFCLGIEPKLLNVHKMLEGASQYIEYPINIPRTLKTVMNIELLDKMRENTDFVANHNSDKMDKLVAILKKIK
jgi:polysaccharide pyruvyl transferase WcaK-like protein